MSRLFDNLLNLTLALMLAFAPLEGAMAGFNLSPAHSSSGAHRVEHTAHSHHADAMSGQHKSDRCHCTHSHDGSCCQGHGCASGHCASLTLAALTFFLCPCDYTTSPGASGVDDRFTSQPNASLLHPPKI